MSYLSNSNLIQNYVHHVDTSFTKEVISTTIEYIPGTEVTYTVSSGASKVVYECDFQISWNPDHGKSYCHLRLQYSADDGSSWTDISGSKTSVGNESSANDYNWHTSLVVFVLDTWSGERKLRLVARSSTTSDEFTIGRSYNCHSSSEGVGSCPHVSIYSVMS